MPRKFYKHFGTDVITFAKREGNRYKVISKEIRALYRDEQWNLYIRNYKSTGKRYLKVKRSKNKKIGLFVVI